MVAFICTCRGKISQGSSNDPSSLKFSGIDSVKVGFHLLTQLQVGKADCTGSDKRLTPWPVKRKARQLPGQLQTSQWHGKSYAWGASGVSLDIAEGDLGFIAHGAWREDDADDVPKAHALLPQLVLRHGRVQAAKPKASAGTAHWSAKPEVQCLRFHCICM